jgi:hypothetical protein
MARKFAALAELGQASGPSDLQTPEIPDTQTSGISGVRNVGRPRGKRSDAEWTYANVLVRKANRRAAQRKLEDEGTDRDLSELIDRLLGMYVRGEIP